MTLDRFNKLGGGPNDPRWWGKPSDKPEPTDEELIKDFIETRHPAFLSYRPSVLGKMAKENPEELKRFIDSTELNREFLLKVTRMLGGGGMLDLNRILHIQLNMSRSGEEVSEVDAEKMLSIQQAQYRGKYPEGLTNALRADLLHALKNPHSRFYSCKENDEMVTYVRFDYVEGDVPHKHMASFMTNPEFEGGTLGQALLEVALEREVSEGIPIYAECDPSLVEKYRKFGFDVKRSYVDEYGVPTVEIELLPRQPDVT